MQRPSYSLCPLGGEGWGEGGNGNSTEKGTGVKTPIPILPLGCPGGYYVWRLIQGGIRGILVSAGSNMGNSLKPARQDIAALTGLLVISHRVAH
jgi:hypothetical protein